METVEVSRHPDGRRRFYGRLFRESGPPFVSERSAITCPKILPQVASLFFGLQSWLDLILLQM
jgi:hypothetical protein